MAQWQRWLQSLGNGKKVQFSQLDKTNVALQNELSPIDANPEALRQMVEEAVVISDRLHAAVSEVDSSMSHLDTIANRSAEQEEKLRQNSQTAIFRLEEVFTSLQELAAASQEIRGVSEELNSQSRLTREVVVEVSHSLNHTDEVMIDLYNNHGTMEERV
jgi:methyl-accepting chemotaxis protein